MVVAAFAPGNDFVALGVHRVFGAESAKQVVDLFGHENIFLGLDVRAVDDVYFGRIFGNDGGGNCCLRVCQVLGIGLGEKSRFA